MSNQSENTKRIAKNTLMLYARMLLSMLVSLYTSRVVLQMLGEQDYGIYNVVGGFVVMFSLISSSLSSSTSRFLTFELGRKNLDRLKQVFATSLTIHLALALLVLVLAETIGLWFLNTQMTIPSERMYAANCVFQASIFSFMLGLFSVPYNASIVSHERMNAFAYIGILDVFLKLMIVLFVAYSPFQFDKLIVYACLLTTLGLLLQFINMQYCRRNFEECTFHFSFQPGIWKEMSAFAGWNFIGCTAGLLKDQGVNILLNMFMGPVVNAARGIAMSVNAAVGGFVGNFMTAMNPQITKSYAANEQSYLFSLVERGSRFSFYILFILALPIGLEADFVLTLWLGKYPDYTVNFVRLILVLSLCDVVSATLITLQTATGKIRNYQLAVGGLLLMNFPLSYVCLSMGFPPESTLVVAIIISLGCLFLRLVFLRKMANLSMRSFLKNVCAKALEVVVVSVLLPVAVYSLLPAGWSRFLMVLVVSLVSSVLCVYWIGCSANERNFIGEKVRIVKDKLKL